MPPKRHINKVTLYKTCKVSLIGPAGIGKTRWLRSRFRSCFSGNEDDAPTLGVDIVAIGEINNYIINFWDFGGQYPGNIQPQLLSGSDVTMIMVSPDQNYQNWIDLATAANPEAPIIILINDHNIVKTIDNKDPLTKLETILSKKMITKVGGNPLGPLLHRLRSRREGPPTNRYFLI